MPFVAFGSNPILTKIKREAILPQDTDFRLSFFSIVASLKALQCVNLRAKGRFSYSCVFVNIAPLRSVLNCEVCV